MINFTTFLLDIGFNVSGAKDLTEKFIKPLWEYGRWLLPALTALYMIFMYIIWLLKDEQEKQQQPYIRTVKKAVSVAVIAYAALIILSIFGLNTSVIG